LKDADGKNLPGLKFINKGTEVERTDELWGTYREPHINEFRDEDLRRNNDNSRNKIKPSHRKKACHFERLRGFKPVSSSHLRDIAW
jgi:hypothetical protein